MDILTQLLNHLKEKQSYCPMCGGEYVCEPNCILDELWFPPRNMDEEYRMD